MADVDDATPLPDTDSVHDDIKQNVLKGSKMLEIFDLLADGKVHKKADVMDHIGYTNKNSFSALMSNTKKEQQTIKNDSKKQQNSCPDRRR